LPPDFRRSALLCTPVLELKMACTYPAVLEFQLSWLVVSPFPAASTVLTELFWRAAECVATPVTARVPPTVAFPVVTTVAEFTAPVVWMVPEPAFRLATVAAPVTPSVPPTVAFPVVTIVAEFIAPVV